MPLGNSSTVLLTSLMAAVALAACGGGGGHTSSALGGEVAGLGSGQSLVLSNNGSESLTRTSNGAFAFSTPVDAGGVYNVTVATQPSGQSCAVTNGSGTASGAVSNIQVQCADVDLGSAACIDNPQLRKKGNEYTVVTPQESKRIFINELSTYHGYTGVRTTFSLFHSYSNVTDGMLLTYGSYTALHFNYNESYYVPGRGFPVSLNLNQTYAAQGKKIYVYNNAPDTISMWSDTVTYLGREKVTTAFGTFETCRLRYTAQDDDGVVKTWDSWLVGVGKYAGLSVQEMTEAGTTQPTNITVSWE